MTKDIEKGQRKISDIPVGLIDIINPRERNQKTFKEMIASIKALGLKSPSPSLPATMETWSATRLCAVRVGLKPLWHLANPRYLPW